MNANLKKLYEKLKLIRYYEHAEGIMYFDFETCVPKDAMENEGDTMSFFSNQAFKIKKSKAFEELVIDLYKDINSLDYLDQILVKNLYESYQKAKNITPKMELAMSKVYNQAYIDWLKAKNEKNYKTKAAQRFDDIKDTGGFKSYLAKKHFNKEINTSFEDEDFRKRRFFFPYSY